MRYVITLSLILLGQLSWSQDAVFSQFYNSNAVLNPALTGVFDGGQRLTLQYRDQWAQIHKSQSYRTVAASFDAKIHMKRNDFLTYGIDFTRDQAGAGAYTQQAGHLNIGYIKQIGTRSYSPIKHFLSGGLKVGFGQNSVNVDQLWFGSQFDTNNGYVDLGRPTNEDLINMNGNSPLFGDFGLGLMYYNIIEERKTMYIGVSGAHLAQPNISMTEFGDVRLRRLVTVHAGGEFPVNRELSIMPNFVMHFQSPARMFMPGAHVRYMHQDWKEIALRFGAWLRTVRSFDSNVINDAIIFSATFEYEAFLFGLSYDVTTSRLINANSGRGAFELSVQYRNRDTKYRTPIKCPKM